MSAFAGRRKQAQGDDSSERYLAVVERLQVWCAQREVPFRAAAAKAFEEFMQSRSKQKRCDDPGEEETAK